MHTSADPTAGIMHLLNEIKRCQDADATVAATAMVYICIDTMAFLSMPTGQTSQTKRDFIAWVDTYLKADPLQSYQYRGVDVYAARCSLLHAFGAEADAHRRDPSIRQFGYADTGPHAYNAAVSQRLVIVSVARLIHDLSKGLETFISAVRTDLDLRARVGARLPALYNEFPFAP